MIGFMLNDLASRHRKVAMNSEQSLHERFPMAEIARSSMGNWEGDRDLQWERERARSADSTCQKVIMGTCQIGMRSPAVSLFLVWGKGLPTTELQAYLKHFGIFYLAKPKRTHCAFLL